METAVQVHVPELSDLCFIMKISNTEFFKKLIFVHFFNNWQMKENLPLIVALQSYNTYT